MVIKKIVDTFLENGFIITPDTLNYLENINIKNRENLIKSAIYRAKSLADKPLVITRDFIIEYKQEKLVKKPETFSENKSNVEEINEDIIIQKNIRGKKVSECIAKEIEPIIEINKDPTGNLIGTGSINDVHKYFINRFKSLQSLLLKRSDSKNSISIDNISKYKNNTIKIIGIVKEKSEHEDKKRKGAFNYFLELEDLKASVKVFISGSNKLLAQLGSHLMLDQIICVEGMLKDDLLYAENIYFPGIPDRQHINKIDYPLHAALISDTHFGSKKFLSEEFQNFIDWLKGNIGSEKQRQLAYKIKYILIAGDLIDGVGVYPEHEKNLSIIDVKAQYELAAEYLKQIPEYISIIIIPGGAHDAVRKALPQEAIPRTYAKPIYSLKNTIMLGNPSFLTIHGMKTIMYHGEGLDDVIPSIPGMSYSTGDLAMIELLKSRHLAPIYGKKVGISPEPHDWLVINDIPDLFQCGHTHINRSSNYKGIRVINSGTFQGETQYQQSLGIKPTPGIVTIVNISDFSYKLKKF